MSVDTVLVTRIVNEVASRFEVEGVLPRGDKGPIYRSYGHQRFLATPGIVPGFPGMGR